MTGAGRLAPAFVRAAPWMVSLALHGAVLGGVLWARQAATVAPAPAIRVEVVVIAAPAPSPEPGETTVARATRPPPAETEAPEDAPRPVPPAPRVDLRQDMARVAPRSAPAPVSAAPPRPRARPVAARPAPPDKPASVIFTDRGGKAPDARVPVTTVSATVPATGAQTAAVPPETPPRLGPADGNAAPRYPFVARENGWQGRVVLRVAVDAAGRARDITVKTSSGHATLDRAARDAVGAWRFRPATRLGRPVAGVVDVPVSFRLRD